MSLTYLDKNMIQTMLPKKPLLQNCIYQMFEGSNTFTMNSTLVYNNKMNTSEKECVYNNAQLLACYQYNNNNNNNGTFVLSVKTDWIYIAVKGRWSGREGKQ